MTEKTYMDDTNNKYASNTIQYPSNIVVDLDMLGPDSEICVKYKNVTYKIDIKKFLDAYGTFVKFENDLDLEEEKNG